MRISDWSSDVCSSDLFRSRPCVGNDQSPRRPQPRIGAAGVGALCPRDERSENPPSAEFRTGHSRVVEQVFGGTHLEFARRLDVELFDDAVVDEHRIALAARAEAETRPGHPQIGKATCREKGGQYE